MLPSISVILDVTVKLSNGIVEMDLCCKPMTHMITCWTARHTLRNASTVFLAASLSELDCSNITDFEDHVTEFAAHLKRKPLWS